MQRLLEFSESAIAAQPLEYLYAVWRDTLRLFDPEAKSFGDLSAEGFTDYLHGFTSLQPRTLAAKECFTPTSHPSYFLYC